MLGLSTADGFMSVKEGIDVMIKYLANEPSVGLYFVQQHAQASMPHLLDVKEGVMEKVNEVTLHTEDAEDSIDVVRTMTEIGYPLAEEMIKDIKASLQIMSKGKPKRGLLRGHQTDNVSKVGSRGYLSAVFSSAKQGTAGFRWPLTVLPSEANQPSQSSSRSGFRSDASDQSFAESEELPLSSSLELDEKPLTSSSSRDAHDPELVYPVEDYNRFKFEKEAKFEAWLHDSEVRCKSHKTGDL